MPNLVEVTYAQTGKSKSNALRAFCYPKAKSKNQK